MRHDTQIYKEGSKPTAKELDIIDLVNPEGEKDVYNDKENGYYAISLPFEQNNEIGESLVDLLNTLSEYNGKGAPWYLGDPEEEYVFVD